MTLFIELLQVAMGNRDCLSQAPSEAEWRQIYEIAQEQAVLGVMLKGLERLPGDQRPPKPFLLQWIGECQIIRQQNNLMDKAVVRLCQIMKDEGIRIFIFKGQAVATYYKDPSLRQSGDIDFYCYRDDWKKAVRYFREVVGVELNDLHSRKDVGFTWDDIIYEMHNRITLFNYPPYSRYWERVVMPEILAHPNTVSINGYEVPTLAPTYNALFIFVHIFQHLIADGIGLRQFVDWYNVLEKGKGEIDRGLLQKHLEGLGLKKAYSGLGAILTDYLGMSEDTFPFEMGKEEHDRTEELMRNIFVMGNFGHNVQYKSKNMMAHGLEHIGRMSKQAREFYHYAPAEAWWHIPSMFSWWGKKIVRMIVKH